MSIFPVSGEPDGATGEVDDPGCLAAMFPFVGGNDAPTSGSTVCGGLVKAPSLSGRLDNTGGVLKPGGKVGTNPL